MIIYHGHPSQPSLDKCRQYAPSYRHGAEFSDREGRRTYDEPYIIDNGAFASFKNGEEWEPEAFEEMLEWVEGHQREPDFVIIPDVVGDAEATYERSSNWASKIDYAKYQPVQDGMDIETAIDFALDHNADGIFIGGSKKWKKKTARHWVHEAHKNKLKAHIARPWSVPKGIHAADRMGADSVDTTSIVAWAEWGKLKTLEKQTTLV